MKYELYDALILGGGPAGLTAAIYTSRAHLNTVVLAGSPPGGQLINTTDVENYPGFPEGILGPDLVTNFRKQASRFGATFLDKNAVEITGSFQQGFTTKDESGAEYKSKTIVIATGASAKWLGLESETRLKGKGVSACAVCDGFFFKDKVVAVVGAGDSAMEESIFLTKYASKIYILIRSNLENMKASKIMQKRAMENPKIEFVFNTEVIEVLGENSVTGLKIHNTQTGQESQMDIQGLFLAIGHEPNTKFLQGFIDLDDHGYIKVEKYTGSSKEGFFVGGDVSDYR